MQTHAQVHAHRCRQSYRCTHLGQRPRSEGDRELWVTDLAKVAYVAWPNHTRKIQFNSLPVHREQEREGERHRKRAQFAFCSKGFVSSEYFTEMRGNEKQRSRSFFLSRD